MIVLGIETSSPACSIGVVDGKGGRWVSSLVDQHVHSDMIVTLIRRALESAHLGLDKLESVAVSAGPGSFTGLRIGMSAAKGLCRALSIPLVAVPTFEAVACEAFDRNSTAPAVMVAVDAKRDDFYIALFAREANGCRAIAPAAVVAFSEIRPALGPVHLICTDRADRLQKHLGPEITVMAIEQFLSGARVAALGREAALRGHVSDIMTIEPLYLKDFVVRPRPEH